MKKRNIFQNDKKKIKINPEKKQKIYKKIIFLNIEVIIILNNILIK